MVQPEYVWVPVHQPPRQETWRKPVTVLLTVFAGLWLVSVITIAHAVGWIGDEFLLETSGHKMSGLGWLVVGSVAAVLCATPPALLAFIPRAASARAAGRAWSLAVVAYWVLNLARVVAPALHHERYLTVLAALAALGALALRLMRRGDSAPAVRSAPAALFGLAAGGAAAVPWLWVGALGGAVETALVALATLAVGWLTAEILGPTFWQAYGEGSVGWRVVVAGLVAGVTLAPLGAALGGSGIALAELLVLPPLGFAVAALARHAPGSCRWLVAAAAYGPLAFVDPDETTLVLGLREAAFWAMIGAACALGVALLVSLGYALSLGRGMRPNWLVGAVAVAAVAVAGTAVYAAPGQPGWNGDRLFVVLNSQADLSGLAAITDRTERVRQTYQRLTATATSSQAPLRKDLNRLHVGYRPYYMVNAIEVDAGDWLLPWLAQRDDVDRVLPSPRLRPVPESEPPLRGDLPAPSAPPWNLTMIGADKAHNVSQVTGAGIVVGNSDSGMDGTHPALRDNFRGGEDSWYDPWNHSRTPTDHNGHGTHTMGTAAGGRNVGVAPGAQWIGCVNLARNLGNPAHYLDCLQFMLAPFPDGSDPFTAGRPERAPHVLTNSWGCPEIEGCDLGTLRQATGAFTAAGIFFVAAAGNTGMSGCRTVTDPPAPYGDVVTVGAVDRNGTITDFSSRGPTPDGVAKPDVFAPGAAVLSSLPGGGYGELDGTSMATPHVAGVVALMWSANPKLIGNIPTTRSMLRGTTFAGGPAVPQCGVDVRIVNADAAVRAAKAFV